MTKYYFSYLLYSHNKLLLQNDDKFIKEINEEIYKIENNIKNKNSELLNLKKDLDSYMNIREEYDQINKLSNLYQLYISITNLNGIPYEMLKIYLPIIESDVNQILHSMVTFNVEMLFCDDAQILIQKNNNTKVNTGCINITIIYPDAKPYNVQLASGFEKFIIELAIRMALGKISLASKSNFLIIDEGWSCLDADNRNNLNSIMNYIKNQYEHVIIISHIEELKNQIDYIISIDKKGADSHINTSKKNNKCVIFTEL